MNEMRCDAKLHGIIDGDVIEVKCRSSFCRKDNNTIVLHRFSAATGDLIETLTFKNPERRVPHGTRNGSAVRPA